MSAGFQDWVTTPRGVMCVGEATQEKAHRTALLKLLHLPSLGVAATVAQADGPLREVDPPMIWIGSPKKFSPNIAGQVQTSVWNVHDT